METVKVDAGSIFSSTQWLILGTLLTITVFIGRHIWKMRHFIEKASRLPGIKGVGFFGIALELLLCPAEDTFTKISVYFEKNFGLCKFWLGNKFIVAVNDPNYLEKLISNKDCWEKDNVYDILKPYVGEGLITAPAEKWKKNRRLLNPSFKQKILNGFVPVFCKHSNILMDILEKGEDDPDFNINEKLMAATLDTTCDAVMGVPVDAQTSSSSFGVWLDSYMEFCSLRLTRFIYRSDFIFYLVHGTVFSNVLANIESFSKTVFERQKQIFNQEMSAMKEGTHSVEEEKRNPTFLKLLLEVSYHGGLLSDQEIQEEINTFIAAATDTSASALSYCCLLLAMHPEYQQRVYEEAVGILGKERDVTFSDIPEFQFLDMCLKETLRLFPVIPFVVRITSADIELDNYIIPEGTSLLYCIFATHRSPKNWKDPLKFNPYRFSPEESAKMHPYSYMPFMKGPRTCIGQKYSFMVMKVMLTKAIRRFQFNTEYRSVEEVELKLNLAIRPKHGFKLTLKRRV
ncbi:cytochrome P450 4C1-like [Coccinella septempunctata]|uniref:cytochrome P450 4C1-like n=1 Tax=Coccinella septempunctata TaxID=41139 RepID=UPI001D05F236|nr:cytochrome P450 4C1-like [Coccinella septempunctata]XP_044764096.1 cytochrome P450 4C1-like [Coccinella septempunctata]XP_044764097.1 cytochrome P450 4C1-like [Coccinella septempunctata]